MAENSVVLVTGVSSYWGEKVAARLLDQDRIQVIGLDDKDPAYRIENLEFIAADLLAADFQSDDLAGVLKEASVDTVCHLKNNVDNGRAITEDSKFTRELFDICQKAGVQNIVVRSSTSVYGAHRDNPAFFREDSELRMERQNRNNSGFLELELICKKFKEQNPQIGVAILRFANIVGQTADSPMTRYLSQNRPNSLLGFDPIFQLIHEDDVSEVLAQSAVDDWSGIYNIAADGSMPLSRVFRLTRKIPVPIFHPFIYGKGLFTRRKSRLFRKQPLDWDYLRYSCVADTDRMREDLSIQPRFTAEEALLDFSEKKL